ncbi:glutaredoxin family protein [Thermoanaerobacterium butyriciformans]|uniref:Glutaredoxin 3 n=1 Tax=Thermoanaerobacterium butyriciformans TaxID=1702242 RepID=A0ABS4NIA5_9THEO|nr:glutaredoxin family protein [Thermoanaerobacterium butyriciformans]MBP2073393.1 glutaredoxin 3 [Thermoanaerobacterium butyriciformans]
MEKLIVYTLPTCPDCAEAKRFLKENGIDFEERDCSIDIYRDELLDKYKRRIVPTLIYKNEIITGFSQNKHHIMKLLGIN